MSEVDAVLDLPDATSLTQLDNTLRMFVTFCAAYHGESHMKLYGESANAQMCI